MGNDTIALWIIALILAAIVGAVIGFAMHANCEECIECEICPECEVCEECEVIECEVVECGSTPADLLDTAIDDLLEHMDDEDLLECKNNSYDADEVTVKKIYDEFSVEYDVDKYDYVVSGKVKLSFKQEDESRCRDTVKFTVSYEEDEDPFVTILPEE